jgi:hypothetical protein
MAQEKDQKGDRRCHTDPTPDKMDQHPDIHKLGAPETKENCDEDRIANDRERRRIEKYLAEFVREEDIVKTLKLKSGDIVDCVDIYKQPALRRPGMEGHELQFRPRGDPGEMKEEDDRDYGRDGRDDGKSWHNGREWHHRREWHHKKKYRWGREEASEKDVDPGSLRDQSAAQQLYGADGEICPEKTVPIRRYTIDILQNFETLDDFFNKRPPHNVNGPNNLHQYAHAYRTVNNWGAQSILNVWSPYTERSSEFSLSQIWVVRGSGSNRETVEVGWQKYRDLYGDYRPRLFIYFTPDNYGNGGCYNLSCGAFVQISNSVYIGGGFTNVSSHPHPSTAWEFKIRWQKDGNGGHWWLKYGNTWVGYYPRSLFDSNGLRNYGRKVDFGGEIIDEQPGGRHTRTDMGSGHFPGDGFGYAAYQRQIRYITTSNFWGIRPSLTATRTDSDCYDISVKNSSGSWERYFYFGGWGYWAHCR